MPERVSAGLMIYRVQQGRLEVLLAHPGGPYFQGKDEGHWTIPKGGPEPGEDMAAAARREVGEELGIEVPRESELIPLGSIRQKGGKIVEAWAVEMTSAIPDWDRAQRITVEWPPGTGRSLEILEVDQARFFHLAEARLKLKPTQIPLLDRLAAHLGMGG